MTEKNFVQRFAAFILRDDKGNVLFQHRPKTMRLPDYWVLFGGKIKEGENPEEAVRREAKEELGIDLGKIKLFGRYEFSEFDGLLEEFVYISDLKVPAETLRLQQIEGDDLGYFSYWELESMKLVDQDRKILKELFKEK